MKNPAVDAYIAKAPDFAKPILLKIRKLFHEACPELEEKLKWGCPSFERDGIRGIMAAFKAHVRLVFMKAGRTLEKIADAAQVSKKEIVEALGVDAPRPPARKKPPVKPPKDFVAALKKAKGAVAVFDAFPPGRRREYVDWIAEARTPETRARRIATAVEWISQGKPRHWKYR
jgi:hypothetical protein